MKQYPSYDISAHNTFRMKVKCALYIEYDTIEELASLDFAALPQPVMSIGEGANLLFTQDFPGTVLHSNISYIKYFDVGADHIPVAVGAGVKFDDFIAKSCSDGLWGAENLSSIPGSVGACAVQNVGAYGVEAKDIIVGVTAYDTVERKKVSFKPDWCRFAYRDSRFKDPEVKGRYIITGVLFRLSRVPEPKLSYKGLQDLNPSTSQEVRDAIITIRNEKLPDPAVTGSAGSFFKNPVVSAAQFVQIAQGFDTVPHYILDGGFVKVPAAWMIDMCGLKGFSVGGAAVHQKQPLVIINNTGSATPQDVLAVESEVKARVKERFGVDLQPEVEHI